MHHVLDWKVEVSNLAAVVSNIIFRNVFVSISYSGTYYKVAQLSLCILWRHRFYVERVSWGGVKFISSLSFITLTQWMQWKKVKKRWEKRVWKKRKQYLSYSRLRERDKKNAEYYIGDYCCRWVPSIQFSHSKPGHLNFVPKEEMESHKRNKKRR